MDKVGGWIGEARYFYIKPRSLAVSFLPSGGWEYRRRRPLPVELQSGAAETFGQRVYLLFGETRETHGLCADEQYSLRLSDAAPAETGGVDKSAKKDAMSRDA